MVRLRKPFVFHLLIFIESLLFIIMYHSYIGNWSLHWKIQNLDVSNNSNNNQGVETTMLDDIFQRIYKCVPSNILHQGHECNGQSPLLTLFTSYRDDHSKTEIYNRYCNRPLFFFQV